MRCTQCGSWLGCLLVLASCVGLAGCGGSDKKLAKVEGTVTLDGISVDRGMITFEPMDGIGTSSGGNVEEGKFSVKDVEPGMKKVRISAVKVIGRKARYEGDTDSPMIEITEDGLPPRFNTETELTLSVQPPLTTKDFQLKSTPEELAAENVPDKVPPADETPVVDEAPTVDEDPADDKSATEDD